MEFGIGKINLASTRIADVSGFRDVVKLENTPFIASNRNAKRADDIAKRLLKLECEFCKEKVGLLNGDVFIKTADKTK